ncbi:hypothetical protein [Nostoc sp. NOS(2021)]|nr:hypothetical protein [Nostoc sp. NOS(2021)]
MLFTLWLVVAQQAHRGRAIAVTTTQESSRRSQERLVYRCIEK